MVRVRISADDPKRRVPPAAWNPKALGAYYTDSQIADFLVWWALRNSSDTVLDPSFGGGVFLRSACKRLRELRADPREQVFGIELDGEVHGKISQLLRREFGIAAANLVQSDFFEIVPQNFAAVDVVVGNPPFIRYQRFSGEARKRALMRAAEQGLKLSELCSSWLPFLIHSVGFLRPGGRLAMVIPFEVGHASYARPALKHLSSHFEAVTFLTFRKKLFPDLSEDTLLLIAEGRRAPGAKAHFYIRDLADTGGLAEIQKRATRVIDDLHSLDTERTASGEARLIEALIPRRARELYRELRKHQASVKLEDLADVGIGYVTGANDFFHLSPEGAQQWQIPEQFLRPCVRRGRAFSGLRLTPDDWRELLPTGNAGYLLELPAGGDLPEEVSRYLERGKDAGVHTTFKCRTRTPWYRVPHVYRPDGFLTYMSGNVPRLVANDAGAVAPNTLHILRIHPGARITNDGIAALWQTSLTHLSVEIEGHALGGGMLKLEPREAGQVLLPLPNENCDLPAMAVELDRIARTSGEKACRDHADRFFLRNELGLSAADVDLLRTSAELLRTRRISRSAAEL